MKPGERKCLGATDTWMLELWAHRNAHVVVVQTRLDTGGDREFRSRCACGWASVPMPRPTKDECPVFVELAARQTKIERESRYSREATRRREPERVWAAVTEDGEQHG